MRCLLDKVTARHIMGGTLKTPIAMYLYLLLNAQNLLEFKKWVAVS